jgi:cellulose biosynthesis protein BcsQ
MEGWLKHKYLIDIDGNSYTARFANYLSSGALVFKSSIFNTVYQDWLIPYVHYIPVNADLSDLEMKLKWAMDNEEEARQVAENGKEFALMHLHNGQLECYSFLLLLEYYRLFGY